MNTQLDTRRAAELADLAQAATTSGASDRSFRDIIDMLPAAIYTTDTQGRLTHFNKACVDFSGRTPELGSDHWCVTWKLYYPDGRPMPHDACPMAVALKEGREVLGEQAIAERPDGTRIWFEPYPIPLRDGNGSIIGGINMLVDVTERKQIESERQMLLVREREARREAEALSEVARAVAGLDLEAVVQKATDAATELTGAKFGAFFYNVINEQGEAYLLYTLSGAPREAFEKLGLPRNTAIFGPTFSGEGIVRIGDVLADPRYGKNSPYKGMPPGHLPVRSYLAVPVVSSSGEVLGGLFFAHPDTDVFTEQSERVAAGIAVHAAIAMDNARLFEDAQQEIAERKRIEEALRESEKLLRFTLHATEIGHWDLDVVSDTARRTLRHDQIFGYSSLLPEWSYDIFLNKHVHAEDRAFVDRSFKEGLAAGKEWEFECRIVRADHALRWIWAKGSVYLSEAGKAQRMSGLIMDITQRKHAEEQLRRNSEELARFNRAAVGRELRMIDLKKEVNDLRERLGQAPRYPLQFDKGSGRGQ